MPRTLIADLITSLTVIPLAIFFGTLVTGMFPGQSTSAALIVAIPLAFAIGWPVRRYLRAKLDPASDEARAQTKQAVVGELECPECQSLQTEQMKTEDGDLTDTMICNNCDHHWSLTRNW